MYLIPRNISGSFEFFPGWGWMELFFLIISVGLGYVAYLILGAFTQSIIKILPVFLFGGFGYMATRPVLPDGSSLIQLIKYLWLYKKRQKLYLFQKGGF